MSLPVRSCLCRRHSERFEGPHGPRQWLRLLRRSTCSKRGSNSKFSTERTKSKGGASLMSPPGHPGTCPNNLKRGSNYNRRVETIRKFTI
ncbi:Protein of unknown function [Cotesia congregata]|uniref:Uncharacterized protein n=1 Tax=Cotesia congregata TaxID=51543 RepID=A0A8J2HQK1_COTCN|nr:Protein of unknown function [Cotesia congregata]